MLVSICTAGEQSKPLQKKKQKKHNRKSVTDPSYLPTNYPITNQMFLLLSPLLLPLPTVTPPPPLAVYDLFPLLLSFLSASITDSLCLLSHGGDFFFFF